LKQYFLPPVLESNAKKGYLVPSEEVILATIVTYCVKLVRFRGVLFRKPVEKLESFMNIYYPIDVKCINSKCMALDPVRNKLILDHGIIGSIAFMLQHPSPKPLIEPYISLNAPDSTYSLDMFIEEYSIPFLKTGSGRYYVGFNTFLIRNHGKHRVVIEPPIYYMAEYPFTKETIRVYNPLRKLIELKSIGERDLMDKLLEYRVFLTNPYIKKKIENGLKTLFDKKVITAGDSLLAISIIN